MCETCSIDYSSFSNAVAITTWADICHQRYLRFLPGVNRFSNQPYAGYVGQFIVLFGCYMYLTGVSLCDVPPKDDEMVMSWYPQFPSVGSFPYFILRTQCVQEKTNLISHLYTLVIFIICAQARIYTFLRAKWLLRCASPAFYSPVAVCVMSYGSFQGTLFQWLGERSLSPCKWHGH